MPTNVELKNVVIKVLERLSDGSFKATGVEIDRVGTPLMYHCPNFAHPILKVTYPTGQFAPISEESWNIHNKRFASNAKKQLPESRKFVTRITWDDGIYTAGVIGGTDYKDGDVLYVHEDDAKLLFDTYAEFYRKAEDHVRLSRALICDGGLYGYRTGMLRIKIVEVGTVLPNGVIVGDGNIVITKAAHPEIIDKIKLGLNNGHYSVWGCANPDAIKDELDAGAVEMEQELGKGDWVKILNAVAAVHDPEKDELLKICPSLIRHPHFSEKLSAKSAQTVFNWHYSPWLETETFYAMACDKFVNWNPGKWSYHRFPRMLGSQRTIEILEYIPLPADIVAAGTATITGTWEDGGKFHIKCGEIILEKMPEGYEDCDVIVALPTIKMGKLAIGTTWNADCCLTVIQVFDRDCIVGIPPSEWIKVNGDYDSDLGFRSNLTNKPKMYAEAQRLEARGRNFKFKKKSVLPYSIENAVTVALNAMAQSMGFVSNLYQHWMSFKEETQLRYMGRILRDTQRIHSKLDLDGIPWRPDLIGIEEVFSAAYQYQVDSIKNLYCNTRILNDDLCKLQSTLLDISKKIPGWIIGKRSGTYEYIAPILVSEMDADLKAAIETNRKTKKAIEVRVHVPDICDSTTAYLHRLHGPIIQDKIWSALEMRPNPLPLRNWMNWAPPIGGQYHHLAEMLVEQYKDLVAQYEVMRQKQLWDPLQIDDVIEYRSQLRMMNRKFVKDHLKGDMKLACKIVWRYVHESEDHKITACLFDGFFTEVKEFVVENALTPRARRCIIGGFKDIWNNPEDSFTETCHVFSEGAKIMVNIENHVRMNVIPMDKKETDRGYSYPAPGYYVVSAKLCASRTAYDAVFEPI